MKSVESVESMKLMKSMESEESMESIKSLESLESMELPKSMDSLESSKPLAFNVASESTKFAHFPLPDPTRTFHQIESFGFSDLLIYKTSESVNFPFFLVLFENLVLPVFDVIPRLAAFKSIS